MRLVGSSGAHSEGDVPGLDKGGSKPLRWLRQGGLALYFSFVLIISQWVADEALARGPTSYVSDFISVSHEIAINNLSVYPEKLPKIINSFGVDLVQADSVLGNKPCACFLGDGSVPPFFEMIFWRFLDSWCDYPITKDAVNCHFGATPILKQDCYAAKWRRYPTWNGIGYGNGAMFVFVCEQFQLGDSGYWSLDRDHSIGLLLSSFGSHLSRRYGLLHISGLDFGGFDQPLGGPIERVSENCDGDRGRSTESHRVDRVSNVVERDIQRVVRGAIFAICVLIGFAYLVKQRCI